MKKRVNSRLKVSTTVSLNKTKPAKPKRLVKLQKNLHYSAQNPKKELEPKNNLRSARIQPESQIAKEQRLSLWFIPARLAFLLSGFYCLIFSSIAFLGVFSNYKIIQPFFALPFEITFSSLFLLEIAAMFSLIASFFYFYSALQPKTYRWFYFFQIIILLPAHFFSNLLKLQIELSLDFQNYLYFDTIAMTVLWGMFILSIYPFLKTFNTKS